MIDAHCHLDAYADPYREALAAERARVLTIAVTNSPAAFERARPHLRPLRYVRLALGLHPLLAESHGAERARFAALAPNVTYIGEVGLDFSTAGQATRELQLETFRFVLRQLRGRRRLISVHSRRAESAVIDLLAEIGITGAVFHWFSGPRAQLDRLLAAGHLCSVNPAMVRSIRGRAVIERLPPNRTLTETDGPFATLSGRPAVPADVRVVEVVLAEAWGTSVQEVEERMHRTLRSLVAEPSQVDQAEQRAAHRQGGGTDAGA